MIRLALVKFPNESPGTYVIPVKDILDLVSPKSTTDFLPNHLYNIKWPVEARQHSDTTEDEFGGFVLLLAASPESMIAQAAAVKPVIKLPPAFLQHHFKKKASEGAGKPSANLVALAKLASKQARRQVNASMELSCRDQLEELAKQRPPVLSHGGSRPSVSSDPANPGNVLENATDRRSSRPKRPSHEPIVTGPVTRRRMQSSPKKMDDEVRGQKNRNVTLHTNDTQHVKASSSDCSSLPHSTPKLNNKDLTTAGNSSDTAISTDKESLEKDSNSKKKALKAGNVKSAKSSEDSNDDSEPDHDDSKDAEDYNPFDERPEKMELIPDKHSTSSVKNLQDQIIKLKNDLAQEQKKSRKLETELISCKLRLSAWKGALVKLNQTAENEAASPAPFQLVQIDSSSRNPPLPSSVGSGGPGKNACRQLFRDKGTPKKPEPVSPADTIPVSPAASSYSMSLVPKSLSATKRGGGSVHKAWKFEITPTKNVSVTPRKTGSFVATDADTQTKTIATSIIVSSPKLSKKKGGKGSAGKVSASAIKIGKKKSSVNDSRPSLVNPTLAPGQKNNKQLAPMILRALQQKEGLEVNEKGQFLIGNNVYIRSSQWDDIKSATNLSIMVKDLAEAIWGYKRCATFSLKGGRSPKSPEAELKPAAPAGDVQAILGVFRAKKELEGMSNSKHLDLAVEKEGGAALRGKFADSDKKLKRQLEAAAAEQAAAAGEVEEAE